MILEESSPLIIFIIICMCVFSFQQFTRPNTSHPLDLSASLKDPSQSMKLQESIHCINHMPVRKQIDYTDTQTDQHKQSKPSPIPQIRIDSGKH